MPMHLRLALFWLAVAVADDEPTMTGEAWVHWDLIGELLME